MWQNTRLCSLPFHQTIRAFYSPLQPNLVNKISLTQHKTSEEDMGNCRSCFCCTISREELVIPKTPKLIDVDGNVKEIKIPVKVAEIMLEESGHVVSSLEDIRRSQRVVAMKADDELLAVNLYFLVPLSRLHSKITESEMIVLEAAAAEASRGCIKRVALVGKVLPAASEEVEGELKFKVLGDMETGFNSYQSPSYRQWNPVLEPIAEYY